jgi:hypothetical protein
MLLLEEIETLVKAFSEGRCRGHLPISMRVADAGVSLVDPASRFDDDYCLHISM